MARENTRGDIILLALTVTLVPPLALTAVEALLWAVSPRLRRAVHLLLVALLVAAFLLQLLGDGPGGSASVLIPIAVAVGVLAALAYDRSRAGPMLLTVLSPFPLVLLVVFLMLSPVSKLVLPGAEVETSEAAIPRDAPVVMIVFDELSGLALMGPDGEINESRYPSFARLADDATLGIATPRPWRTSPDALFPRCSAARSPIKAPLRSRPTTREASSRCWVASTRSTSKSP